MDMYIDAGTGRSDAVAVAEYATAMEDGCGVALREFLTTHYQHLHRRLQRHLGCPDQASDCLHDAWIRLGEMTVAAVVQSPEAYVYRVACNIAIDRLRSDRPRRYAGDVETELNVVADPSPGPERIAEARSDMQALHRALQDLPRRHRAVLEALRIDELTRQEVATHHEISLRSVDTVLRQALDFCAEKSGQLAMAGVRSPRRALLQGRHA